MRVLIEYKGKYYELCQAESSSCEKCSFKRNECIEDKWLQDICSCTGMGIFKEVKA